MTKERIAKFCEKFNTHKATLIQDTDRYLIIDWRRADGSGDYYVNYIVDKKRGNLIVSGDLGDSIATWYNKIKPSDLKNYVKNVSLKCGNSNSVHHEQIQEFKRYLGNIGIPYKVIDKYVNYHYGYARDGEGNIDFSKRLSS